MRSLILFCALIIMAVTARAQPTPASASFKDFINGKAAPLTLKLKDMNDDWRRVSVSGSQFDMGNYLQMFSALYGGGGSGNDYFTMGDTIIIGGETYAIAYRLKTKPFNIAMMAQVATNPPKPEKLTEDTILTLSLLNLRTTGSFSDIRPFDLKMLIAESDAGENKVDGIVSTAQDNARNVSSLSNLRQLGTGMLMYTQDYDEVLPPMKNLDTVKKVIMPYIKNEQIFINPITKEPYGVNSILSMHKLAHLKRQDEMVVFYETTSAPDGTRGVAFLDGHALRVQEADWVMWKKKSKIP